MCTEPVLALFVALAAVHPSAMRNLHPSTSRQAQEPAITSARLDGRRVTVSGASFGDGAVILLNGKKQKTESDPARPANVLVGPEAGIRIGKGEVIIVQVQNPGGATSPAFGFFTGRIVSLEASNKTIRLKTGERFLLYLRQEPYEWTATVQDSSVIRRAEGSSAIPGSQGVFEALRPGKTSLAASGELPCHKVNPPCMAPTLGFEVRLVVE